MKDLLLNPKVMDSGEVTTMDAASSFPSTSAAGIDSSDAPPAVKASRMGAGLENLGNTCFVNVVLQCLTHTVPVVEGLRSCSRSAACHRGNGVFCALCALRDHVELSLSSSGGVVQPLKLVENLSKISSSFQRFQQEDAHEFLQCMLDTLESCYLDSQSCEKSTGSNGANFIKRIFGGRLRSQLRCCSCRHCSDTFEPLIDLSLEIEKADSLYAALGSFTQVENIEDSEMKFTCENCKKEVSVEKQLTIEQAPEVATFHLKRFKTDGQFVEKIRKPLDYPLELDLQPFLSPQNENYGELKYDLYAVVVHTGYSSCSGHYFCFVCSSPHTWHELDDSQVMRVSEDYVLRQEAYILFYKRREVPWFSAFMEAQKICQDLNNASTSPKSVLDVSEIMPDAFSVPLADGTGAAAVGETIDAVAFSPAEAAEAMDAMASKGDVGEAFDAATFYPLTPPPRSPSPKVALEEPSKVNYSIPRNHLRSEGPGDANRPSHSILEDGREKEAVNRLLRGMPSSRSSQLRSCIATSRECLSESSINQIKRQKVRHLNKPWSDGEASSTPSKVSHHQRLSPRSVMHGLVSADSHLVLQFESC